MLYTIFLILFIMVCLVLCFLVLIQSDKGGGLSGSIGGGLSGASNFMGVRESANILTKGTTYFAVAYMVLCIILSLFLSKGVVNRQQKSVLQERAEQKQSYTPSDVLQSGGLPMKTEEDAGAGAPPSPAQGLPGEEGGSLPMENEAPVSSGE